MKVAIGLLFVLTGLLSEVLSGRNENCRNPNGADGDFRIEGCLRETCKAGVWRHSLEESVCCYDRKAYPMNSDITAATAQNGCTTAKVQCIADDNKAKMVLRTEDSCPPRSTYNQVEEIKEMLVKHLSSKVEAITTTATTSSTTRTTATTTTPATTATTMTSEKNLLYLGMKLVVELPSFSPSTSCSMPFFTPFYGPNYRVTGIVAGEVLICGGGDQSICHSLVGGRWTSQPPMQTNRKYAAASLTDNGLLVTGGEESLWSDFFSTEYFTSDGWVYGPPMPASFSKHCQVTVGRAVIVTGGYHNQDTFASVYKLESGVWTRLPDMKYPRRGHSCAAMGSQLFVMGGHGGARATSTSVEVMDISSETWSAGPSLPDRYIWGQAVVYDSFLYVLYQEGKVLKMTDEGKWDEVATIAGGFGMRPVFPAPVVTAGMLGC